MNAMMRAAIVDLSACGALVAALSLKGRGHSNWHQRKLQIERPG